jgi:hypothetical protein
MKNWKQVFNPYVQMDPKSHSVISEHVNSASLDIWLRDHINYESDRVNEYGHFVSSHCNLANKYKWLKADD